MNHVSGYREAAHELASLSIDQITRDAVEAATDLLVEAIRSEAPERSGLLRRGISARWVRRVHPHVLGKMAGVNVGQSGQEDADHIGGYAPHGHLVALGTNERFTESGAGRGVMPSNDFVGRGMRKAESPVTATIATYVSRGLRTAVSAI